MIESLLVEIVEHLNKFQDEYYDGILDDAIDVAERITDLAQKLEDAVRDLDDESAEDLV